MAHGYQGAKHQDPNQYRKQRLQKACTQANQNVHDGRYEVEHAVITAELAAPKLELPVKPVGIDCVLSECRSDTNGQDPWECASECAGENAADDKYKIAGVTIPPPSCAHSPTPPPDDSIHNTFHH